MLRLSALACVVALEGVSGRASPSLSRRAVLAGACGALGCTPAVHAAQPSTFSRLASDAALAFQRADYANCERLWREATVEDPSQPIAWANLAIALIINSSDEMQLGVEPTGRARDRLEEALVAVDRAEGLNAAPDALNLNAKGNALGLLLRWSDARVAYAASASAAGRDFESIPRSNEALALFELGALPEAERQARTLVRRDPAFRDGQALLATLRYEQGDKGGAANAISALCEGPGGAQWCARYSSVDVVIGRWSPRAVGAYRRLLAEPSIQLELRNGQGPRRGDA